jgi:hypothetical protein
MAGWQDGRMAGWQDGKMAGWQDGRMRGWQDCRMARLQDGKMAGWLACHVQDSRMAVCPLQLAPEPSPGQVIFYEVRPELKEIPK